MRVKQRALAALTLAACLLSGCLGSSDSVPEPPSPSSPATPLAETGGGAGGTASGTAGSAEAPSPAPVEPPPLPPPSEATLVAVGDVMMHTPMLPGAYDESSGTYDFSGFFAPLRTMFEEADWAVANLETPIAGDERGFRGYPLFNAPVALADALAEAGFDVVSTANNHSLDQGFSGLVHTLGALRDRGVLPVGTAESEEASNELTIVEKNGIRNAFLSYTYGTNGIPIPKDKPFAVNLIDDARIAKDIAGAEAAGADVVTVSLHFGNEYQREPTDEQRRVARRAIEAGADVVLGHHPHVVQPYERIRVEDEDGKTREGVVIYSLGNFISNQFGSYKEYGAALQVTFRKTYQANGASMTTVSEVDAIPTWVHKYVSGGKSRYRVLSLDDIKQESGDPLLTPRMISNLIETSAELNRHMDKLTAEIDQAPSGTNGTESAAANVSPTTYTGQ
ncbi:MAG TPA: CapA family protein [Paenibacillus sp.]|nr:CapA family protein [Paenibacillus sp.]